MGRVVVLCACVVMVCASVEAGEPVAKASSTRQGPFMRVGGAFGEGFRASAGYSVRLTQYWRQRGGWKGGVSMESDFEKRLLVQVVPTLEYIAPGVTFFNLHFGVGAGVPLRLSPDLDAGLRVQVGGPQVVGLLAAVDFFPVSGRAEVILGVRFGY